MKSFTDSASLSDVIMNVTFKKMDCWVAGKIRLPANREVLAMLASLVKDFRKRGYLVQNRATLDRSGWRNPYPLAVRSDNVPAQCSLHVIS